MSMVIQVFISFRKVWKTSLALLDQYPNLNATLLSKYEEKIRLNFQKYRYRRQAENNSGADLSDGIDVEVSLEVASSVKSTNSKDAINVRYSL